MSETNIMYVTYTFIKGFKKYEHLLNIKNTQEKMPISLDGCVLKQTRGGNFQNGALTCKSRGQ